VFLSAGLSSGGGSFWVDPPNGGGVGVFLNVDRMDEFVEFVLSLSIAVLGQIAGLLR